MSAFSSLLVAVAPNGARRGKADHPALPITPQELAAEAKRCADAGAAMLHLHVRDEAGGHSLAVDRYRDALQAVGEAVGERLLLQVSSEAAGKYRRQQQMAMLLELNPAAASCGVMEFIPDESAVAEAKDFFATLTARGTLVQFIVYQPRELVWLQQLVHEGVVPQAYLLLFVVGSYASPSLDSRGIAPFLAVHDGRNSWMACGFGTNEVRVVKEAIRSGGHVRVGFENNLLQPDGRQASSNATLVGSAVAMGVGLGRPPANAVDAVFLHGQQR